jgi:hypothetical protein
VRRLVVTVSALFVLACVPSAPSAAAAARRSLPLVSVRTVPATPGVVLTFEGRRYVTDRTGRARIPHARGVASVAVLPHIVVGSRRINDHTIVRFARWFTVGPDSVAALDVFQRTAWTFVDAGNSAVPASRVERLVLRSTSGEVRVLQSNLERPRWLFSRHVSFVRGRLVVKDIDYAVQRVTVLGADVVNAGQQTFVPAYERSVRFTLAFFALTVRGEDALFGSSVAARVQLELPNGVVRNLKLVDGEVMLAAMPRGTYRVTLQGGAYSISQPLVLSRSQVAVVPLVTYLDVLVVGGGLLVLAIGLVLVGRPYLARRAGARIASRGRSASPQAE